MIILSDDSVVDLICQCDNILYKVCFLVYLNVIEFNLV